MDTSRAPRFCLGIYWPDDYTDYLVHFHEPFEVFRLELDRDGPIILWVPPDSPFERLPAETFDEFARAARVYLGMAELVELGTPREIELRVSVVPFPPLLMVSNREAQFHAILGLGDEPFTAFLTSDENEPLISDVALGFTSQLPEVANELSDFAEAYYTEFYDRQDLLDKKNEQQKGRERRGGEYGFSRN